MAVIGSKIKRRQQYNYGHVCYYHSYYLLLYSTHKIARNVVLFDLMSVARLLEHIFFKKKSLVIVGKLLWRPLMFGHKDYKAIEKKVPTAPYTHTYKAVLLLLLAKFLVQIYISGALHTHITLGFVHNFLPSSPQQSRECIDKKFLSKHI